MPTVKGPSDELNDDASSRTSVTVKPFTLRDLYVRASISGNSLATELACYFNIESSTLVPDSKSQTYSQIAGDESSVHEKALAAILEVVTANSKSAFEHVRIPEPTGGVQEWWTRMLSGSVSAESSTIVGHAGSDSL